MAGPHARAEFPFFVNASRLLTLRIAFNLARDQAGFSRRGFLYTTVYSNQRRADWTDWMGPDWMDRRDRTRPDGTGQDRTGSQTGSQPAPASEPSARAAQTACFASLQTFWPGCTARLCKPSQSRHFLPIWGNPRRQREFRNPDKPARIPPDWRTAAQPARIINRRQKKGLADSCHSL